MGEKKLRIWEIDFLRGIAIILMVIFHVAFDLNDIYNFPVACDKGIFYFAGKTAAILFITIAGISCSFSRNNIKRGLKVFSAAMAVTIATYIFTPGLTIKFGILHFLGISMMLYPLLKKMNNSFLLLSGTLSIAAGYYISKVVMLYDYLFPLGLHGNNFASGDYYPLFPWIGLFMFGIVIGRTLYYKKKSLFKLQVQKNPIMFMGRHSLLIYLIHQPVILLVLKILIG